jgi:hypothetical protein
MWKSLLFGFPIVFLGVGTIFAVQDALGFRDPVRDMLVALLLVMTMIADDKYGPRAAEREREGRR